MTQIDNTNDLMLQRREKLNELRAKGCAYPNDFRRDILSQDIHMLHGDKEQAILEKEPVSVKVAGRMMLCRLMGKASFAHIQDMTGKIQLYVKEELLEQGVYDAFKKWDLGDIVGAEGILFRTKTGELSVRVNQIRLLSKSLRPLPDKFHGLHDQESRYRQRYLDLLVNDAVKETFYIRTRLINAIREFLMNHHFLEVETPMMQVMHGGAAAKPFVTHHHALDMDLYLRIAPELYLKRLVVGGIERIFEINRNFRNEGVSTQHNPEFTMLEFYEAYATYTDLMTFTEKLFRFLSEKIFGKCELTYQGRSCDLGQPFKRMTLKEAILHYNPDISESDISDIQAAKNILRKRGMPLKENAGLGKLQLEIFEKTVERQLLDPTFITEYPAEVSPLARRNEKNHFVTDRFEFFIAGMEIANGFSELNDPEDQAERFKKQRENSAAGDEEAMPTDMDYVTALEYGLPPTAGEGIGIDRLVMLFTDSASIRDVILFPHMRIK